MFPVRPSAKRWKKKASRASAKAQVEWFTVDSICRAMKKIESPTFNALLQKGKEELLYDHDRHIDTVLGEFQNNNTFSQYLKWYKRNALAVDNLFRMLKHAAQGEDKGLFLPVLKQIIEERNTLEQEIIKAYLEVCKELYST